MTVHITLPQITALVDSCELELFLLNKVEMSLQRTSKALLYVSRLYPQHAQAEVVIRVRKVCC